MRRNYNLEELAELMIDNFKHGYSYQGKEYEVGEMLDYFAKRIANLEMELDDLKRKVDRIPMHYIRKNQKDTEDEQKVYMAFNSGIDSILQEVDMTKYIKLQNRDRDKYY